MSSTPIAKERIVSKKNKNTGERLARIETDISWIKWIIMAGIPAIILQLLYVIVRLPA